MRLDAPDIVGEFCSFEKIMAENTAYKSMRYRCGRKQDTTVVIVAQIYLRFSDVKRTPGLVAFEAEVETCLFNGATGELQPPPMGNANPSKLKDEWYRREVIKYGRAMLPESHALSRAGWKELPLDVAALSRPIGFND